MNCQYILQNEIHEKFLKGLLGENQKAEFELHLNSCESCSKTFKDEKALFDGIRLAGRQAMKLEIERQVEKLREEQAGSDWTLIFKVAAVLFFLVIMPGTLYFLNTDLFMTKDKKVTVEKFDKMSSVEMEEAKPSEERGLSQVIDESATKREIAGRPDGKAEESVSTASGKGINGELKAKKSVYGKEMEYATLDDISGGVEGSTGEKSLSGGGAVGSVSKQISPSSADIKTKKRRDRAETVPNEKIEIENLSRQAPALSSQPTRSSADQTADADKGSALSLDDELDSKKTDILVYKLVPSEPRLLQQNYLKNTETGTTVREGLAALNFSSGYKQIVANIVTPSSDMNKKMENDAITSFKVIVLSTDSGIINMNWYLQFDESTYQPDNIFITQPDNSNLLINFDQKYIFKVDISRDTTEAVLQK